MKTIKGKNLTVTLKTNGKGSDPVFCNVGGVVHKIKLSKDFKNAGTIYNRKYKGKARKDLDIFIPAPCDHSRSMVHLTDIGIIGHYDDKTKVDTQWMFRRCQKCGELQSAKLGKWQKANKMAHNAYLINR